ncbi:YLP motif-containing protein 1-like [Gigantopelta aegis]|uniref:YLP motif-containing protein 1-like n=1 Tax=Gigantopelta aegis TaxID=1735272 RepID=UPI001B88C264|nr:YLP motif-containing protein 1-like [Gigantopelta aegis]
MNQYPGFVPMMVPQHYMVAMPGLPLPPGLQAAHAHQAALQQMMPPSVVPHPGVMAPGSVAQPGIALPPGTPISALTALQQQQERKLQVTPPEGAPQFQDVRQNSFPGLPPMGFQWPPQQLEQLQLQQQQQSILPEEPGQEDVGLVLDDYNSDLSLVLDNDGYGGFPLNKPSGFCFTWSGVRCTYGVCRGKILYEVRITEELATDFGSDHNEENPHILRVGWSIDSSSFQLGEEPWSYGYGGTGKFSSNNKFVNYGQRFGLNDVIGAMLDLDSRPATISYMKNGKLLGVATQIQGYPVGNKDMALFPHILTKNCRFRVNLGQEEPWFPPDGDYKYIGQIPLQERVQGQLPPAKFSDCEMIMIIGLPGSGKTTWAINMQKNHPEKRYNIVGSDTLIDKMRVMGLPRKRNYHGRWENLIDKATKCLNKLFLVASKKKRNYILDQTNVYPSARVRKMKNFNGFFRIGAVVQPDDGELERRSWKRTHEDGKFVPEEAVIEMKANYVLPDEGDPLFDRIDYIELPRHECAPLVEQYRQVKNSRRFKQRDLGCHPPENQPTGSAPGMAPMVMPPKSFLPNQGPSPLQDRMFSQPPHQMNYPKQGYDDGFEPPAKRAKPDSGSALDFIKQEYAEDDQSQTYGQPGRMDKQPAIKEEARWDRAQYAGGQLQNVSQGQRGFIPHLQQQQLGQPGFGAQLGAVRLPQPGGMPQVTTVGLSMAHISQPPPPPPPPQAGSESQELNPNWQNRNNPEARWPGQGQNVGNWQQQQPQGGSRPGQSAPEQRNWQQSQGQGQGGWPPEQRSAERGVKEDWQQGPDKANWQANRDPNADRQLMGQSQEQTGRGWQQGPEQHQGPDRHAPPGPENWQPSQEHDDLNQDTKRPEQRKGFGAWDRDQGPGQQRWQDNQEQGNWKQTPQGPRQPPSNWQQGDQDQRKVSQGGDSWQQGQNKWPPQQQQWAEGGPEQSRRQEGGPGGGGPPGPRQTGRQDDSSFSSHGSRAPLMDRPGGQQTFDSGQERWRDQGNFDAPDAPRKDGPGRDNYSRQGDGRDMDRFDRMGGSQGSDSDMRGESRGFGDRRENSRGSDRFDRGRSNRDSDRHGGSQYDRGGEGRGSSFDRRGGGSRKFDSDRGGKSGETDKFGREIRSDGDRYSRNRDSDTERSSGRGGDSSRYGRNQSSDADRYGRGQDSDSDRRSRSTGSDRYSRDADRYSRDRGSDSDRFGGARGSDSARTTDNDRRSNRGPDSEKQSHGRRSDFDRNEGSRNSDQSRRPNDVPPNQQAQSRMKPESKASAPSSADKSEASAEDRPRRRKSKWDTPSEDAGLADKSEAAPSVTIKQEPGEPIGDQNNKQMDTSVKSSPVKIEKNQPPAESKSMDDSKKNQQDENIMQDDTNMPPTDIRAGDLGQHQMPMKGMPGGFSPPPPFQARHPHPSGGPPPRGPPGGPPRGPRNPGDGPSQGFGFGGPRPFRHRGPGPQQFDGPRGPRGPPGAQWNRPRFGPGGPSPRGPGGPGGPGPRPLLSLRGLGPGDRFQRPGGRFPRPF